MPTVKHMIIFADGSGHGWTEVHYKAGGSTPNLTAHLTLLKDTVCPARAALLGKDCAVVGCRVSYPRINAIASMNDEPYNPGMPGVDSADETLALAIKFKNEDNTKKKILHLRGFPNAVQADGDYHPEGGAAFDWLGRLANYKTVLITTGLYGWLSKDNSAGASSKGDVTTYLNNANGTITFTVAVEPFPESTWGKIRSVRFSRLNNGKSTLNRTLLVRVNADGTQATTVQRVAAFSFQSEGRYNYRSVDFVNYATMGTPKVGRRPQGRPIGKAPGRRPARALG